MISISKRTAVVAMILVLLVSMVVPVSFATATEELRLVINETEVKPDVPPQIINGRTMVPVRVVSASLGEELTWDQQQRVVFIRSSANKNVASSAEIQLVVDDEVLQPDVPPQMVDNRTLVPLRVISEALGAKVNWDQQSATVTITSSEEIHVAPEGHVLVPNKYDEEFMLSDDELFIFVRATNQFELPGILDKVIGNKLKEAFPDLNIRLEVWDRPVRTTDLVDIGVAPDIYITGSKDGIAIEMERFDWAMDMTDLIEQSEIDLESINQAAIEMVRSRSSSDLYGVPIWISEKVLYYNKDTFDAFDQDYPENGMTYDEIYELTQHVTGQAGVQTFKGLAQHPDQYLADNQLGLIPFKPISSQEPTLAEIKESVDITTDDWLRLTENMHRFLSIPGNNFVSTDDFFRKGNYAMAVDSINKIPPFFFEEGYMKEKDRHFYENWSQNVNNIGVVSVPVLSADENWTYQPNVVSAHLAKQSDQKEQAMEVIEWLVSEEAQLQLSRNLFKAVVETDEIIAQFGADLPNVYENVAGMGEAVYWGENAYVQNYEQTKWPDERFPLWFVFRQNVLQNGDSAELALINAQERDIANWYGWLPREEWE